MSTLIDRYNREIVTSILENDEILYSVDGISIKFPTSTPEAQVLSTFDAMAPAQWSELEE